MKQLINAAIAAALVVAAVPALAEVAVVVNPKAAESAMTKEQVAQFFLGKSTAMTPIDQPEDAPVRAEFYKKVTDKDASQAKAGKLSHSSCSACSAFCAGAVAPPSFSLSLPFLDGSEAVRVPSDDLLAGFIPDGLQRPPRQ